MKINTRMDETKLPRNLRRRKKFLVVDVETANTTDDPLVYDIGFAIADKYGHIYEKYSFIVNEIFYFEKELMDTAYYAQKLPLYYEKIRNGEILPAPFWYIRRIMLDCMKRYNAYTVAAYNCMFDRNALNTTVRYLTKSKYRWYFPRKVTFVCIWHMACHVIFTQTGYQKFARKHALYSPSGAYIQTSAEAAHAYALGDPSFEEEHTGLADVEIEVAIMARAFAQHKKMKQTPAKMCWRIPNTKDFQTKFKCYAGAA